MSRCIKINYAMLSKTLEEIEDHLRYYTLDTHELLHQFTIAIGQMGEARNLVVKLMDEVDDLNYKQKQNEKSTSKNTEGIEVPCNE